LRLDTEERGTGRKPRIVVASDHAGFYLKCELVEFLRERGYEVSDLGSRDPNSEDDYPDFGAAAGRAVASGEAEVGVCVCGTGIGIAIAANKVPGVRAAVVHDVSSARLARAHNDANIVCFGARLIGAQTAKDALVAFLEQAFAGGRHQRRVDKIAALEGGAGGDEAARSGQSGLAARRASGA
jgi:ribose 5-phosphate isomerase B